MKIVEHIERIRKGLREGRYTTEAAISQGVILPALNDLGWPVFDTSIVIPEYSVGKGRVDYALCHPKNEPAVFIEVKKKIENSKGADQQLFEYAFHRGVPMAILTDGQVWSFYLPAEQGHYSERRVYKLDLLERDVPEIENRFNRYLNYKNVCSEGALAAARKDYQDVSRTRIIESNLPKAWKGLLKDQDPLLLEMFSEKVEALCGYKPDLNLCSQFLNSQYHGQNNNNNCQAEKEFFNRQMKPPVVGIGSDHDSKPPGLILEYKGQKIPVRSAIAVLKELLKILQEQDNGFLERFSSRAHSKKRRYVARDKYDLYAGRPDLVERHSVEIFPGWWLGTNYSRNNIHDIIKLALEVADPKVSNAINAKVF